MADHIAGDGSFLASLTFGGGTYDFSIASGYRLDSPVPNGNSELDASVPLTMTMTPAPEPTTLGLLGASGLAFAARARRWRRGRKVT
jgi:hypothetical protein